MVSLREHFFCQWRKIMKYLILVPDGAGDEEIAALETKPRCKQQ
jgi:hypothetical protein